MTNNILLCCTLTISLLALSACGQQTIPNSGSANNTSNTQNTTAVPGSNEGFASAPIVAPPNFNQRPLKPGESPPPQKLPNGLPALQPLKGVNVDKLFAENLTNTDRRFERVENAVVDMRREFEAVKPAIVRLVAVEEDIQKMVEQLEAIASQEQFAAPPARQPVSIQPSQTQPAPQDLTPQDMAPAPASAPMPVTTPADAPAPKPTPAVTNAPAGAPVVKNLRTGVHNNKKRVVLDMSKKTPYTVDLDSSENILVIELPQAGWNGATTKTFSAKEPLLASYNVQSINNGQGTRIVIPLKRATSIAKQAVLPPGSNPNFRMYIDLNL